MCAMVKQETSRANLCLLLCVISAGAGVLVFNQAAPNVLLIAATVFWFLTFVFFVRSKRRHWALGVTMPMLGIFGLVTLLLLQDRSEH